MTPFSLADSISLNKKNFFRAPQWELKLALKIVMGFVVLYFLAAFIFLGIGGYSLLVKKNNEIEPILLISEVIGYYFAVDLLVRYFFQSLPVTDVKSLLILPISKKVIIRGVLLRSLASIFNAVPLVVLLPFCIVHSLEKGVNFSVWVWFLSLLSLSLSSNFLTLLINKSTKIAKVSIAVIVVAYGLNTYADLSIINFFGKGLQRIFEDPIWVIVPIALLYLTSVAAQNFLKKQLFLDKGLTNKKEQIIGSELRFFDRWEGMGFFLKNDFRLIIRNIRSRQVVLMGFLFLFYGLIFFTQERYFESPVMLIFSGLFITGGFMLSFGQFVPAWDSEYYSLLMCQNLSYRKYLKSKLYLILFSVGISTVLSLPYLYFGLKVMAIILATAVFNFGLGSMITLFSGAFNTTPIKLNIKAKAFENTQNFSFTQMLFILPKLVLPIVVFYVPFLFLGFRAGLLALVIVGILGIVFQKQLLNRIVSTYKKRKYQTISSFKKQ